MFGVSRAHYTDFCTINRSILPIFVLPEWMDVVTDNSWVPLVLLDKNGVPYGISPLQKKTKLGIPYYTLPLFSPKAGLWLRKGATLPVDFCSAVADEFLIFTYILTRLFRSAAISKSSNKNREIKNLHTFVIHTDEGIDTLYKGLHKTTKRIIQKAEKQLTVSKNKHFDTFVRLYLTTAKDKDFFKPAMVHTLPKLLKTFVPQNGILFCAFDVDKVFQAGLFVVFDANRLYGVASAASELSKQHGVARLLLWEAIKESERRGLTFDFGGGNEPSVGAFFKSFGAEKEHYQRIKIYKNTFLKKIL